MNVKLTKLYYDTPSLLTAKQLSKKGGVSLKEGQEFINNQEVNQLHYPKKKKIKYYPIYGPPGTFQIDLTFYKQYKGQNSNYYILLTAIEVNSRQAYAIAMKHKTADDILEAFDNIIEKAKKHIPVKTVSSDKGSEFAKFFTEYLKKKNIKHFLIEPGNKNSNAMVESWNRTLRNSLERYMTAFNTNKYIDVLDDLVDGYNNRKHSVTGFAPNDVGEKELEKIRKQQFERIADVDEQRLKVGDSVRVLKPNEVFQKIGERYFRQVYTVASVNPFSYDIKNEAGDTLQKTYMHYQLHKIDPKNLGIAPTKDVTFDPTVVKKQYKTDLKLGRAGVDPSLIIEGKRSRKPVSGRGKIVYFVS